MTNVKLLTIKDQPFSRMPDISTMTKFRAGQALVGLNERSNPLALAANRHDLVRRVADAQRPQPVKIAPHRAADMLRVI